MAKKGPGKIDREGLSLAELFEMFPDEKAAVAWFESTVWPDGERYCGKCGSTHTREVPNAKPMPYWCKSCRSYFSVRTGTPMQASNVPMRKWAIAIYLCLTTNLKSCFQSMRLSPRARHHAEAIDRLVHAPSSAASAAESDNAEDCSPGRSRRTRPTLAAKRKNMSNAKRRAFREAGSPRGPVDKTAVVGMKDRETNEVRAEVVQRVNGETLQGFVREHTEPGATVYTDEAAAYKGLAADYRHEAVNHTVSEYVRGQAHTNGMESFWSMLKRAHDGTFHKISPKHLQRYVSEFAGKHNHRDAGTLAQMRDTVARLVGRSLLYRELVAPNGLSNAGR